MTIRTTTLRALDGVVLKDARYPHRAFPPHFHDAFSIALVASGLERLSTPAGTVVVPAGAVVVIPPGLVHAHSAVGDAPFHIRALYMSPDVVDHRRRRLGDPARAVGEGAIADDAELRLRLERVHDGTARDPSDLIAIVDHLILRQPASAPTPTPRHVYARTMDAAAAFIRQQFSSKLRTDDLAARFGMAPSRFVDSFRRRHGLSPTAFHMVQRINESRARLARGGKVVDVAIACGFYDQSHFIRHFKRHTGTPPSDFQRFCADDEAG